MSGVPPEVEALLRARDEARAAKDFAQADALRSRIEQLGFTVRDAPSGAVATPKPGFEAVDPARVPDSLSEPPARHVSIHVLYEGYLDDVTRFLGSIERHCSGHDYEIVVTEAASPDADRIEELASGRVRVLHLSSDQGWAASRNAALRTSRGSVVALADLSVEATGDLLGPVLAAFEDPAIGVAGPWGLRSADLRTFEESPGPEVDAIEGYFLATRREILAKGLIDPKYRWYRHADIDLSFQIRAMGYKAVVATAPAIRHAHRAWEALDEAERAKRSKWNFYRFLDRFKDRADLLVAGKR